MDFEVVSLNSMSSDDDVENALLAIKRNGIAMKGILSSSKASLL